MVSVVMSLFSELCCTHLVYLLLFFFFKQKTAYEMRISDWSSDVCSSALQRSGDGRHPVTGLHTRTTMLQRLGEAIPEQARGALYFVEIENTTALRDRFGYAALEGALVDTGRHVGELAGEPLVSRLNDNTLVVYAAALARSEERRVGKEG